jgi:hypothetical protein
MERKNMFVNLPHIYSFKIQTLATILYKYGTQELYICDRQTQLTTSLLFQNLTTYFGSRDIVEDHSIATHPSFLQL